MRIVVLGTGPFAVPMLRALAVSRHDVLLVVTRPPRGRAPQECPMQRESTSLGIESWSPESVNTSESRERLAALGADLLVVCDYGEILRSETLALARLGGINLHGSLLPKYRGAAPVQWALLQGDLETGNTIIQMTPGLDAGPCLAQQRTPIDPEEDAEQLEGRLATLGAQAVLQVIDQLEAGTAVPAIQQPTLVSKAPRLRKEQGAIDWSRPAREIKNQVRALRPWPRAFTYWHRTGAVPHRVCIDRVAIAVPASGDNLGGQARDCCAAEDGGRGATDDRVTQAVRTPGEVVVLDSRLFVAAADGLVEILELQPAGKRSMTASEYLRGRAVQPGDWLGPEHA